MTREQSPLDCLQYSDEDRDEAQIYNSDKQKQMYEYYISCSSLFLAVKRYLAHLDLSDDFRIEKEITLKILKESFNRAEKDRNLWLDENENTLEG